MLPDVNLLPQYERHSSVASVIFIVSTVVIVLAFCLLGFFYFKTKSDLQTVEAEYSEVNNQVEILQAEWDKLAKDDTSSIEQAIAFIENYTIPTSRFIVEINELLPEQGYLKEYVYENQVVKPKIHVETLDAVADYTTALLSSEFIIDTKVNRAKAFTVKDEGLTDSEVNFDTIPRFEADFTLEINKTRLKEEALEDE